MATAPSPFFYGLPSAATYPPPAYDFSPAPQFGYSNFPSAVVVPAYAPYRSPPDSPHHTQLHGYPYPPPASPYMAATGFSPVPTYDPATPATPALGSFPFGFPPDSAYAPAPTFHSPITTKIDRNQPAPAATQIHVDLHHHFPPTGDHLLVQPAPQPTSPILPTLPANRLTSGGAPAGRTALELHTQEVPCTPENSGGATFPIKKSGGGCRPAMPDLSCQGRDLTKGNNTSNSETLSMVNASTNHRFVMEDDAAVQAVAEERVPAKNATLHRLQQQQREQIFNDIQGQLAKLTAMASQLAISLSKHSTSPHTSTPAAAPASAVSQVFGEMPTPNFLQETHGTDPRNCSRHHIPIQSTCVSNFSEQNFDGMCQPYGFHSLKRQSVFLADGTEHKYFTLPADYPLERAVPEPVFDVYDDETEDCPNAIVDVSASTPEQQPYEEQHESWQAPKCFSMPTFSSSVGPFSFTEVKKSDSELLAVCFNNASNNAFSERELSYQPPRELSYVVVGFPKGLNLCNQVGTYIQQLRDPSCNGLINCDRRKEWDPGDSKSYDLFTHTASATKLQNTNALQSLEYMLAIDTCSLSKLEMSYFTNHMLQMLSASCQEITEDCFADRELMANTSSKMAELMWHSSITRTPFILLSNTTYTWDHGVLKTHGMLLDKFVAPYQVQSLQQTTELSLLSLEACIKYYAQNGFDFVLHGISFMLQLGTHSSQDNDLCSLRYKTEYCQMKFLWEFSTKLAMRFAALHSSKANLCNQVDTYEISSYLGFAFSEDTVAMDCCNKPTNTCFSAVRLVDLLLLYYSQGHGGENRETLQWDPGIGTHLSMDRWLYWHQDIKLNEIALWLITFIPP